MSGARCGMRAIACSPSLDRDHLDVLAGERQLDDALDRDAVVGKQELVRHGPPLDVPARVTGMTR